jgi:hypothetical protein
MIKERDLVRNREKDRFNGTPWGRKNEENLEVDFQFVSII